VRSDLLRSRTGRADQLRRAFVCKLPLRIAQVGVDGRAYDGVDEAERPTWAEDLDARERRGGRRRLPRIEHGERSREVELRLVAEDGDGARQRLRRRAEPPESLENEPRQPLGLEIAHTRRATRSRLDPLGLERVEQLLEEERIPAARDVHGAQELRRGLGLDGRAQNLCDTVCGQARRPHDDGGRVGLELRDERRVGARLARSNRRGDDDRKPVEPPREVRQEAQRRSVAPLEVVDDEERGRPLGDVRGQPVEAVKRRERRILVGEPGADLGQVEERRREMCRPRQQATAFLVSARGEVRLEQLTNDAVREVRFQLAAARAQDLEPERLGALTRAGEQTRLPDPGRPLEEKERAPARGSCRQVSFNQGELALALDQGCLVAAAEKSGGFSRGRLHRGARHAGQA
jgi:hypothetical protein